MAAVYTVVLALSLVLRVVTSNQFPKQAGMADGISQRAGRDGGRNRDLISALHDDLLLRILGLLPEASDTARTSILSRRWRSLWPNAPVLRFAVGETPKSTTSPTVVVGGGHSDRDDACWLISAATTAIARRAAAVGGPDVKDLQLSFIYAAEDDGGGVVWTYDEIPWQVTRSRDYRHRHRHAADVTPEHVATWLAFATRRVTGRLTLAVPPPELFADDGSFVDECDRQRLFAVLPSSARAQQMSLTLGTAILAIPTTVAAGAFAALTDLLLSHAHLVGDGDGAGGHERRLSRLVSSSCCPRLWRLRLEYITGVAALRFGAASTLRELELYRVLDLRALDVDAPGLSVLRVEACHILAAARVSAPWLEVVTWKQLCRAGAPRLELDGAASVRCIEDLLMFSHWPTAGLDLQRHSYLTAPWFLIRHCTSVNQLSMTFIGITATAQNPDRPELEDMMKDIPQLPNVSNLTIKVLEIIHAFGAILAKLIAKCDQIKYLTIQIATVEKRKCADVNCICYQPKDWDNQEITLKHLTDIEIHNLVLLDNQQIRLVRWLLASSPSLQRMTVTLDVSDLDDGKDKVFDIPCYGGRWVPCVQQCNELGHARPVKYEWMRGI